jgi:hypothetical protein
MNANREWEGDLPSNRLQGIKSEFALSNQEKLLAERTHE